MRSESQKGKEGKQMELAVYNPQKGRLETIDATFTDENTTWFENCVNEHRHPHDNRF